MTRLIELDPSWIRYAPDGHNAVIPMTIVDATGIIFDCPLCRAHSICVWFRDCGVPAGVEPGPGRWSVTRGTTFENLTLHPSINLDVSPDATCKWHGWIIDGEIV